MTTAPANTAPLTFDDVKAALGETDPFATNAGALQRAIGRGSNATVQKHLDTLRAAARPVPEVVPGTTPKPPADAVDAMWAAAYCAAQVHTLGRLEVVTGQREQLAGQLSQLQQDYAGQGVELDEAHTAVATATAQAAEALAQAQEDRDAALQSASDAKQTLDASRIDFETFKREAQANEALLKKDAQNAALTLQSTIDRLTDQVGELKSLLHHPKTTG